MKAISIEELQKDTDQWVRLAAEREPIVITDNGKPLARLVAFEHPQVHSSLPNREEKIKQRSRISVESADYISEMRR